MILPLLDFGLLLSAGRRAGHSRPTAGQTEHLLWIPPTGSSARPGSGGDRPPARVVIFSDG